MPKKQGLSEKDKQGFQLIAAVVVILLAAFATKAVVGGRPPTDANGCVGAPSSNTVIVLDRSERVSQQTLNEIRARALAFIRDSTFQNELVSVFTVSDLSRQSLEPLIARCRPPKSGNRLIEDVQRIEREFRETFEQPISEALRTEPGNGTESPVAQAIVDISRTRFLRGSRNTLLLFSDMLENTSEYSVYGCRDPETVIPQFRSSRRGAVERPTFRNTRVVLNLIPRPGHSADSLACRDRLWVWFFGDNPGSNAGIEIDYLPGGEATRGPAAKDS